VNFIEKAIALTGFVLLINLTHSFAQLKRSKTKFTRQDTLRGSLNAQRIWWDVQHYEISVKPDYASESIEGVTCIRFKVLKAATRMQIDLQEPLIIDSIYLIEHLAGAANKTTKLTGNSPFKKDGDTWLISLPELAPASTATLQFFYHGPPKKAVNPPWDGGWIWRKDENGNPWISVACQGLGASVWYPCKDHQSDEPDEGAVLNMILPDSLSGIGNGRLKEKTNNLNGTTTWTWEVKNPINNYNIIPYIGKYSHFAETYEGEKGKLDCNYWVLTDNLIKAKEQFKQAASMLKCFEYWFGPYPFYEDGYQLVESPHLGMEHQSAVAYGNHYQNGYLGRDLSGSGWGLKWDFIIIHESGHEWFANNITTNDIADMWVHEGFTNYSESLYTQCQFGKEAGNDYAIGTRQLIENKQPVIGPYGVNKNGSGDMYYKGGNLLHTIRQLVNNDEKFREILRGLNKTFYHQTVTSQQVEDFISMQSGINLSKVFDQYLRTIKIPAFTYLVQKNKLKYRWGNCVQGFQMPLKIKINNKETWITPKSTWQILDMGAAKKTTISVDRNFYVESNRLYK
jgi:aminopeptidase N